MRYVRGIVVDFLLKTLEYVESFDLNICYCISRYKIDYRQNWSTNEFFLIKSIILNFSKYIIFEYHIFLKDIFFQSKNDRRTITQYHYTAWPDHGIPEPLCLLFFHDHLTGTKKDGQTGPILVHCRYLYIYL